MKNKLFDWFIGRSWHLNNTLNEITNFKLFLEKNQAEWLTPKSMDETLPTINHKALINWFSKIRTDCFPGRELFMTDTTLNESDLKFLAEAGDTAVTVDESLFEVLYGQEVLFIVH